MSQSLGADFQIMIFLFFPSLFGSLLLNLSGNILPGYVPNINKVFNFRSPDFSISSGFVIREVFGVRNIGNHIGFFAQSLFPAYKRLLCARASTGG